MRVFSIFATLVAAALGARAQWAVQVSGTPLDLYAVSAVSERVAWVSGAKGTVLHTTDGGATWQRCAVPAEMQPLELRGVQAFESRVAVVMSSGTGDLSRVYKTTDGCRSWELVLQNPDPEGSWDAIQFQFRPGKAGRPGYFAYGVLVGHLVGGEFVLFTSRDYGTTWKTLREDEAFAPGPAAVARAGEVPFAYSNTSLSPLADGNSFAFVTGGAAGSRLLFPSGATYDFDYASMKYSFAEVRLPLPAGTTAGGYSVAARRVAGDRVDLMVVGGDPLKPEAGSAVFVRHGGPALRNLLGSRAVVAVRPPGGFRSAVAYEASGDCWIAVGPTGTDVSRDDGLTWARVSPGAAEPVDADRNWGALSLPFAVGPGGRIGMWTGGGPAPAKVRVAEDVAPATDKGTGASE